jgi:hypothetical protein
VRAGRRAEEHQPDDKDRTEQATDGEVDLEAIGDNLMPGTSAAASAKTPSRRKAEVGGRLEPAGDEASDDHEG